MLDNLTPIIKTGNYEILMDAAVEAIRKKKYQRVAVQLPDGLRKYYRHIADVLERQTGATPVLSLESSYGACDVIDCPASAAGVDCLLHFGHAEMSSAGAGGGYKIPVIFVEVRSTLDVSKSINLAADMMESKKLGSKIGLATTIQYVHAISKMKGILKERGINAAVYKGDSRIKYPGQVLGCNFSSVEKIGGKASAFLFVGSGNFHPLGIALATGKDVIIADPEKNEARSVKDEKDAVLKQRYGAIQRASRAKVFAVLIGTRPLQRRPSLAYELRKKIIGHGKAAHVMFARQVSPGDFVSLGIDAIVSTACPRLAIDDYMRYDIPIITPVELDMALGDRRMDNYSLDQILGGAC